MKPNQQIKRSYFGVIVTLLLGLVVFNASEASLPFSIMILSTGMFHVFNIAQASDPTFLKRNRVLMYLLVSGIAVPPIIYLGKRLAVSEESGIPYSLRFAFVVLFAVVVLVSAIIGTRRM